MDIPQPMTNNQGTTKGLAYFLQPVNQINSCPAMQPVLQPIMPLIPRQPLPIPTDCRKVKKHDVVKGSGSYFAQLCL